MPVGQHRFESLRVAQPFMPPPDLSAVVAASTTPFEARLLDAVQQAVIATDTDGRVVFWNAYATRPFGWSAAEALGQSIVELTPTAATRQDAEAIMANLVRGRSWAGEFGVKRKDGSEFTAFVVNSPILDNSGTLIGIIGISTDVSEQRALERQLRHAAKMEAVGRLAGGVAHDFNNLLTIILGNLDQLEASVRSDSEMAESLLTVQAAARRAADLTRQLLAFSRKEHRNPRVVDVGHAVAQILPLLRRLIDESVRIEIQGWDAPLCTVIDPTQLDQVLLNLAANARDAMPEGGTLRITLEPIASASPRAESADDGEWVRLTVSDTGEGMTPEVMSHIFEPFYTTKESGSGTGLGLATIYAIVTQAGGSVEVESEVGAGTVFQLVLPRTRHQADRAPAPQAAPAHPGPRRILVVEDEPGVRSLVTRVLERAGYVVLAAEDIRAGEALVRQYREGIDLLLSDIVMPGGSGVDLANRLRTATPHLRVVLMTGYADGALHDRAGQLAGGTILHKPFSVADLLRAVGQALSDGEPDHELPGRAGGDQTGRA